ncbi:MAG: methionine adenosyltransferase domain-containing protein [bacterium]
MLKTAESVSPKHPDKLCDRISDAILDACLAQDPLARVAIETMGGHGIVSITGELTTTANISLRQIVQDIVGDHYGIQINIVQQSPEIAQGVDTGGAGDQGIMVGYACRDNEAMIPQELYLARNLCKYLYARQAEDGKTQITIDADYKIQTVVASFANVATPTLQSLIQSWLAGLAWSAEELAKITIHANPAGEWQLSGFAADTGLTGRKLAVDNYGPQIPIGGGAFSGKDASKVDRSGAYMARKLAVDLLNEHQDIDEVMVKLAYAIGVAEPVMVSVIMDGQALPYINHDYNLTPQGIIAYLNLQKPQFAKTAEWGHMGNGFVWDR